MSSPQSAYPLPRPTGGTGRITHQLISDVAGVLKAHGFPEGTSIADLGRLQRMLDRFVYGPDEAPVDRGQVSVSLLNVVLHGEPAVTRIVSDGPR